ncbi:MAG: transporter substrate-binding domain-containing protein [Desulforegulaceae bacterium]|nr:transporter substrate-binding domain-containing protein [Desulforegulaceae bacterium]
MRLLRFCLLISVFFLVFFSNSFAREVVLLGDSGYPPYSFEENGEAKGIYVDVIKRIFERIDGYEVKFTMLPWKRCIDEIKKGEAIAFFPPYYSEEREDWLVYSKPILEEQTIVFGKEGKIKNKNIWPDDFYNSTIGLNAGFDHETMGGKKFANAIKMGMIKVEEAKNNELNLKKLSVDRIDFYINDKMIDISKFPEIKRGVVVKVNWGYLGFTKDDFKFSSYYEDFKIKFNQAVTEIQKTDEIEQVIKKYTF